MTFLYPEDIFEFRAYFLHLHWNEITIFASWTKIENISINPVYLETLLYAIYRQNVGDNVLSTTLCSLLI